MTGRTILAAGFVALGLATAVAAQTTSTAPADAAAGAVTAPSGAAAPQPADDAATAEAVRRGGGVAVSIVPDAQVKPDMAAPTGGQPAHVSGAGTAAATHLGGPAAPEGAAPPPMTDAAAAAAAEAPVAEGLPPDTEAVTFENGRWYNAEGIPTFKIEDGVVDYATFSGYRRYHSECHVCHGPDGEGSSYAPALKNSVVQAIDYWTYQEDVASGIQNVNIAANLVMPAFGTNRNVWCYVDDIYTYLLARGTDAIPRGRPAKRADKPEEYAELENSCMEG